MRRTLAVFAAPLALSACKKPDAQPAAPVDAGPPKSWCESQTPAHSECEDFDGPDIMARLVRAGGDLRVMPSERSKPSAASFRTVPVDASTGDLSGGWMMMNAGIDHPVKEVHAAFAMKLGEVTATAAAPIEVFDMGVGANHVVLELDATGARLVESYMDVDAGGAKKRALAASKMPALGAWHTIAIDFVAGASLTLTIDGERASSEPLALKYTPRKAYVIVGVRQPGAPTANEATFDDVTLDLK